MQTDTGLFEKFWNNTYTNARAGSSPCNADCKKAKLCQLRSSSYDWYLKCMNGTSVCNTGSSTTTSVPVSSSVSVVFKLSSVTHTFFMTVGLILCISAFQPAVP